MSCEEGAGAPISRIVAEVAARFPGERITLGEMAEAFGDRAFGLLILLLLLPSLLPGMASVFGTPVLILGVQMGLPSTAKKITAAMRKTMSYRLRVAAPWEVTSWGG